VQLFRTRSLVGIALLGAALLLMMLNQAGLLTPFKSLLLAPLTPLQTFIARQFAFARSATGSGDQSPAELQARVQELEARIASLEAQLVDYEELQSEYRVLAALLDYARRAPEYRYVTADVIGRDESPFLQFIILNKGSNDGLAADMPVVTDRGLIGQIVEVTATASKVLLVTDQTSAVNARIQSSRAEGVVVGTLTGDLRMQFIPLDAEVAPGDVVLTSGIGGRFPPDVLIGQVTSVRRRTQDIFQEAELQTLNDFSAIETVLVLTNFTPIDLAPILASPTPEP
jgi:rod shape-determining protein MreC